MSKHLGKTYIIEQHYTLSVKEACCTLGIEESWVEEVIAEGIIEPRISTENAPELDEQAVQRLRTSMRLHQDLGVNISGIALVLDLLEELERLRAKVRDAAL